MDDILTVSKDLASLNIKNKRFLILGATGLIGRFFIDVLMYGNKLYGLQNTIIGVGRNRNKLLKLFPDYTDDAFFDVIEFDINKRLPSDLSLHIASG